MYQVTWINTISGSIHAVQTPNAEAARDIFNALRVYGCKPRLWNPKKELIS